jgi:hypothetical protein
MENTGSKFTGAEDCTREKKEGKSDNDLRVHGAEACSGSIQEGFIVAGENIEPYDSKKPHGKRNGHTAEKRGDKKNKQPEGHIHFEEITPSSDTGCKGEHRYEILEAGGYFEFFFMPVNKRSSSEILELQET